GGREDTIPDSLGSVGASPRAISSFAWLGLSCQLSSCISKAPLEPRSSKVGSARKSGTPAAPSDGPIPRKATGLGPLPVIMNPPINTLSPVSTRIRVEIFNARPGDPLGVTVGVALGVDVAVAVAVGVALGVTVGLAGGEGVGVGIGNNWSSNIPRPNV